MIITELAGRDWLTQQPILRTESVSNTDGDSFRDKYLCTTCSYLYKLAYYSHEFEITQQNMIAFKEMRLPGCMTEIAFPKDVEPVFGLKDGRSLLYNDHKLVD